MRSLQTMQENKKEKTSSKVSFVHIKNEVYKEYHIFVQAIGNIFQFMIYDPNSKDPDNMLRSSTVEIKDLPFEDMSNEMLQKGGALVMDQAMATVDLLLNMDNPEELEKQNPLGATASKALEELNKQDGKK